VGWFTSFIPLRSVDPDESFTGLATTARAVKAAGENLVARAWAEVASEYLYPAGKYLPRGDFDEMLLNFVGGFKQLEQEDSIWRRLPLPSYSEPETAQ
jgi:hypothetical protein